MFRDFHCLLVEDCMAEPIGADLPRSNHEALRQAALGAATREETGRSSCLVRRERTRSGERVQAGLGGGGVVGGLRQPRCQWAYR